jgi:hypothetical protein
MNAKPKLLRAVTVTLLLALVSTTARPQTKPLWKSVEFAIVKINDGPPLSWNMYHAEKRGVWLLRIWHRYLLIDLGQQEVFDVDPKTVVTQGDNVTWSPTDKPSDPLDIGDWKERNVGGMDRLRFQLPKQGAIVELQIPLRPDGKTLY